MDIDFSKLSSGEFRSLVQWATQGVQPNDGLYGREGADRARDDKAWRDKAIYDGLYGREGADRARDEAAWQSNEPNKGATASWTPSAATLDGSEEFRQRAIDDQAWRERKTQKASLPEQAEAIPTKGKKRRHVRDMDFDELLEAAQTSRRKRSRLGAMDEFFSRLSPEQMQMLVSFANGEDVSFGPSVDETNALRKIGIGVKEVRTKDGRYVTAYQVRDRLFTDLNEAKAALQNNVLSADQIGALRQTYEQGSDLDDATNPFQKEIKYGSD